MDRRDWNGNNPSGHGGGGASNSNRRRSRFAFFGIASDSDFDEVTNYEEEDKETIYSSSFNLSHNAKFAQAIIGSDAISGNNNNVNKYNSPVHSPQASTPPVTIGQKQRGRGSVHNSSSSSFYEGSYSYHSYSSNTPSFSPRPPQFAAPSTTNGDFLCNSFFMFEETTEEDLQQGSEDDDKLQDKMIYFYPPTVSVDQRLFLIGVIQTYLLWVQKFKANERIHLICMDNAKLAFKMVNKVIMVLTSHRGVPDSLLKQKLDKIYNAIVFFNGPWDHILLRSGSMLPPFFEEVGRIGREISQLADYYNDCIISSFDPIPYTELLSNANSIFINSSQLLDQVLKDPQNLAGCIVFDGSVLCSQQLDNDVLQWILYRIGYMNSTVFGPSTPPDIKATSSSINVGSGGGSSSSNNNNNVGAGSSSINSSRRSEQSKDGDSTTVPLHGNHFDWDNTTDDGGGFGGSTSTSVAPALDGKHPSAFDGTIKQQLSLKPVPIHRLRSQLIVGKNDKNDFLPVFLLPNQVPEKADATNAVAADKQDDTNAEEDNQDDKNNNNNNNNNRKKKLPNFLPEKSEDGQYFGLFIHSSVFISIAILMRIDALFNSKHINKIRLDVRNRLQKLERKILEHKQTYPQQFIISNKLRTFNNNMRSPVPGNAGGGGGGGGGGGSGSGSAGIPTTASYNLFVFNSLNRMGTANMNENEHQFLKESSFVHASFERDPSVTNIILRNNHGLLYAKKMCGTETYYQQNTTPINGGGGGGSGGGGPQLLSINPVVGGGGGGLDAADDYHHQVTLETGGATISTTYYGNYGGGGGSGAMYQGSPFYSNNSNSYSNNHYAQGGGGGSSSSVGNLSARGSGSSSSGGGGSFSSGSASGSSASSRNISFELVQQLEANAREGARKDLSFNLI